MKPHDLSEGACAPIDVISHLGPLTIAIAGGSNS